MNSTIKSHFGEVEVRLIRSSAVVAYRIIRQEIGLTDGKLRVKISFRDGSLAELFEYVAESNEGIQLLKYSFHWQSSEGVLRKRWDNAPHYPDLPNAPHHIHHEDGSVSSISHSLDIFVVINTIEQEINRQLNE